MKHTPTLKEQRIKRRMLMRLRAERRGHRRPSRWGESLDKVATGKGFTTRAPTA